MPCPSFSSILLRFSRACPGSLAGAGSWSRCWDATSLARSALTSGTIVCWRIAAFRPLDGWNAYSPFWASAACKSSPVVWVALHRQHHHAADQERDPHSPLASFLWGHIGWLMIRSDNAENGPSKARYASDMARDPFYGWLEVHENWATVAMLSWAAFFAAGFLTVTLAGGTTPDAIRFGSSLLVWGAAVRTVVVWHLTWSVNSVTHLWGYRTYDTPDGSRNNAIVALLNNGEGWHNNHHADSRSARHGHAWWELDVAWLTIRLLMLLGLASNVSLPSRKALARRSASRPHSIGSNV